MRYPDRTVDGTDPYLILKREKSSIVSEESRRVREKVGDVRRSISRSSRWLQLMQLAIFGLVLVSAIALLDYYFLLPTAFRVAALFVAMGIVVAWGRRCIAARSHYGVAEAAADVEAEFPEYGQRIRTTMDYSDPATPTAAAAPKLVQCLEVDTERLTRPQDFAEVVNRRPLGLSVLGLALLLLVIFVALARDWELRVGMSRAFLFPFQYTQLTVDDIDKPIPAGQDATVVATIEGRAVHSAQLFYRAVGAEDWNELDLELISADDEETPADGLRGELAATIKDCQEDLEYRVTAGPRESDVFRLRVLAPLELKQLVTDVRPPIYTKLEPETTDSLDLKVVEGTNIQFELTLNRAAAGAQLRRVSDSENDPAGFSPDPTVPLQLDGNIIKGRFEDLRESQRFVISARAADGIEYQSPRFRIRVRPDGAPKIRFVKPPEDLEVVPTAEVALSLDVADDYGIRKLGIAAQVANGPLETLWEQDYQSDPDAPHETRVQPVLYLEKHELTFQDAVTYYAYAVDNRPDGGKRTTTELRFIDIRPFKREYQILEGGGT